MEFETGSISGVVLLKPKVWKDSRGYFYESWQQDRYSELGIATAFVQDNVSLSSKGVIRGMHFQRIKPQGKLISVLSGQAFDVLVDVRPESATYGQWCSFDLNDQNHHQLWIPEGIAHGFLALKDNTIISYKCTDYYCPDGQVTLNWNDPTVGIIWPKSDFKLIISEKDANGLSWQEVDQLLRLPQITK